MSQIKGKNTKPEVFVRKFLFAHGYRYKLHDKKLPGRPDLVLPKYKTVIFIHGCFWHGHESCRYFVHPKTRTEWWLNKINGNVKKDSENTVLLKAMGWKVLIVWECNLKNDKKEQTLQLLLKELTQNGHS